MLRRLLLQMQTFDLPNLLNMPISKSAQIFLRLMADFSHYFFRFLARSSSSSTRLSNC